MPDDQVPADSASMSPAAKLALLIAAPPDGLTPEVREWVLSVAIHAAQAVLDTKLAEMISTCVASTAVAARAAIDERGDDLAAKIRAAISDGLGDDPADAWKRGGSDDGSE